MKLLYDRKSSRLRRKPCHNSGLMLKNRLLSILLERGNCKVIAAAHQPLGFQNSGPLLIYRLLKSALFAFFLSFFSSSFYVQAERQTTVCERPYVQLLQSN
jgi:hypothetical protein